MISRRFPTNEVFDLVGPLIEASMYLDTSDPFQAEMAYGKYQPELTARIFHLVKAGDVVLTAGAQLGYVSLALAKAVGPTGRVLAFEADPRMIEACKRNLALNGFGEVVQLFPFGLGSANGEFEMSLSGTPGQSSLAIAHHCVGSARVAVRNGDEVLAGLGVGRIDGMLLDVEGWEVQVLDGLGRTLSHHLPRWAIVECCDVALRSAGSSAEQLLQELKRLGWELSTVDGSLPRDGCDIVCARATSDSISH
jgi:FkbM family methyltransferase